MTKTVISQPDQVSSSYVYNDTVTAGIGMQASASNLQDDLNALRTQVRHILWANLTGSWYDPITAPKGLNSFVSGVLSTGSAGTPGGDFRQVAFIENVGPYEGWVGAYSETVGGAFPSTSTWYTDSSKTKIVLQKLISRDSSQLPITESWALYAADGATVIRTFTDVITYNGVFETNRTRTQT